MVYLGKCHLRATGVGLTLHVPDMLDERALEGACHYLLLMAQEGIHTLVLQFAYYTGTHIHHALVDIGNVLRLYAVKNALLRACVKEGEKQVACFLV